MNGVDIYTGDSSVNGSSIDNIYFGTMSSSTLGDSGGSVQQNSKGVFVDLSLDAAGVTTTRREDEQRNGRRPEIYDRGR